MLELIYIYRTNFCDVRSRQNFILENQETKRREKKERCKEADGKQEDVYQEDRRAACGQGARSLDPLLVEAGGRGLRAGGCRRGKALFSMYVILCFIRERFYHQNDY